MKKLLFIILLFSIKQINAQFCFGTQSIYPSGGHLPESLVSADFNHDGFADLAVVNSSTSNLSILLSNGSTGFTTGSTIGVPPGPFFVCTADFDGDGNADLAVACHTANIAFVLLGNGAGSFVGAGSINGSAPYSVCTGDFNEDGKLDLALANSGTDNVSVGLGIGGGNFGTTASFTVGTGTVPYGICSGDFNSDGHLDLVTSNNGSSNLSLILGAGDGTFGAATSLSCNGQFPRSIIQLDIDKNGTADLAVANYGTSSNTAFFFGDGAGNFSGGGGFSVNGGPSSPRCIIGADFNADGHPDLATADYNGTPSMTVMGINIGVGSGNAPHGICSGDFDGDGSPDIATANEGSDNISVFLNIYPFLKITGTNPICIGNSTTLTVSGASTYTWSANAGSATTASVSLTPTVATTYTVAGINGICPYTGTDSIKVNINPLPTVTVNNATVCTGSTTTLTASGAHTYTWNTSATGTTITPSTTVAITYTVTGTDTNTCKNTAVSHISINPLPTVTVNSTIVCAGTTTTLTASGASTYTWNTNATGATITPSSSVTTTYTVTGTDANTCTNTAVAMVTESSTPPAPSICLVTTDSVTNYNYNIIYWDNSQYNNVDSFIVYRYESGINSYKRIGAVSKDSSRLMDTARHVVGTHDGDPNYTSYKYTLAIKDTCGNVSAQSPYHQTVFMQNQFNGNFNINPYVMGSGQSNPVTGYDLYKDITGTGTDYQYLITITGNSGTDPSYSSSASYRIDILGFNCVSNQRLASGNNNTYGIRQKSHSNTNRQASPTTSINQVAGSKYQVAVYPNPSNGMFYLTISQFDNSKTNSVEIYNTIGQCIHRQIITSPNCQINLADFSNGMYQLRVLKNNAPVYQTKISKAD